LLVSALFGTLWEFVELCKSLGLAGHAAKLDTDLSWPTIVLGMVMGWSWGWTGKFVGIRSAWGLYGWNWTDFGIEACWDLRAAGLAWSSVWNGMDLGKELDYLRVVLGWASRWATMETRVAMIFAVMEVCI
jgi:hypothetical protein